MNRQHTSFDELCEVACAKGLAVGLTVSKELRGEKGREYRDVTGIRITKHDAPKGPAVAAVTCTLRTLNHASRDLLAVIR